MIFMQSNVSHRVKYDRSVGVGKITFKMSRVCFVESQQCRATARYSFSVVFSFCLFFLLPQVFLPFLFGFSLYIMWIKNEDRANMNETISMICKSFKFVCDETCQHLLCQRKRNEKR